MTRKLGSPVASEGHAWHPLVLVLMPEPLPADTGQLCNHCGALSQAMGQMETRTCFVGEKRVKIKSPLPMETKCRLAPRKWRFLEEDELNHIQVTIWWQLP